MISSSYLLFYLFSFIVCVLGEEVHKRFEYKHSFKTPYIAQKDNSVPFWSYWGNAIATADQFRITPSLKSQKGLAWNKHPTNFDFWEVEISFRIAGQRMGADGLALWFVDRVPDKNLEHKDLPVFGSADKWNGFGLFFDSFDNDNRQNNPYVMGMVNDGTKVFDHDKDGFNQKIGGCVRDFRNKPFPVRAKIEYYKNTLTVLYHGGNTENDDAYEICFRADNIYLPSSGYFGVTAATGGMADDQDVYKFLVHSIRPKSVDEHLRQTDEFAKYQKEFEEYERKTKQAREEYIAKHPDAAKKPEDQYMSPEQQSFNQLTAVVVQVNTLVRECMAKMDQVLGKQERTIGLVSGGQINTGGQPGQQAPVPTDSLGSLITGQRDMAMDVRTLRSTVSDIQSLSQQILSRAQGSVQQVGGGAPGGAYDMHITLKELNDGVHVLQRDLSMISKVMGGKHPQGPGSLGGCPQIACASTWVIVTLMVIQLATLIGFLKYRDSRELQSKKFY